MKLTRRRKILRIIALIASVLLSILILVCALVVPSSALVSVTEANVLSLPVCNLSFNFRVYQTRSIYGIDYAYRQFNFPLTGVYGADDVDQSIDVNYVFDSNVTVPGAETYNIGVDVASTYSDYNCEQFSYGFDYDIYYDLYINTLYSTPAPLSHRTDLYSVSISASDFYVWGTDFLDYDDAYGNGSPLGMRIGIATEAYDDLSFTVRYSLQGETEIRSYTLQGDDVPHDVNSVYFDFTVDDLGLSEDTLVYVHFARLDIIDNDTAEAFDNEYKLETYLEDSYIDIGIQGSSLNADLRGIDVQSHSTEYEFHNYTAWLGNAIGGFMSTEIFGGITFGGILAMLLGFFGVVWFLKLFAGG